MWRQVHNQFVARRWLVAAIALYVAFGSVEAFRLLVFVRPEVGAAGVYELELVPSVPGVELPPTQLTEDGGSPGSPPPPEPVTAVPMAANRILFSWKASTAPVRGYKLQHAPLGGAWQTTWMTPLHSQEEFVAVPGSTTCFRVRSFNDAGHSLYSYATPPCVVAAEPIRFSWTAALARLIEPPGGPVLTLLMHPGRADPGEPVPVTVSVDGELLERVSLQRTEWQTFHYYLPIVMPARGWGRGARDGAGATRSTEPFDAPAAPAPDGGRLAELRPWHRESVARPLRFDLAVGSTFVPAESVEGSSDRRQLGVRLAPLQWSGRVPADGIGFHGWEGSPGGRRFRWTRLQASQPEVPTGSTAVFELRSDHPDIGERPVRVRVFWNERQVREIVLRDRSWTEARIEVVDRAPGVLSLRVDRTWVPAEAGSAPDRRSLGVAMTFVEWR